MSNSNQEISVPVVIFGGGSIGERHIKNFWKLGYRNLYVFRREKSPFRTIKGMYPKIITTWEEVEDSQSKIAVICTPTSQHLDQTIKCVRLGINVLVEKPLSNTIDGFEELRQAVIKFNTFVYVGYMMRFHPLIEKIKTMINKNEFGKLISFQSVWAEYLPNWHTWEDYRDSYAARKELGGGSTLTLSHDIDLAMFLVKSPIGEFFTIKNYRSKLEVDVESGSDVLIRFQNGITANIHLNFFEKTKERYAKFMFDNATVVFDYFNLSLTIKVSNQIKEKINLSKFDRNDMFLSQTKFFISKIDNFSIEESIQNINNSQAIINICNYHG